MSASYLSESEVDLLDAWWRAANYLTIGQIYLQDNPLLLEPLSVKHIKPRLLGHWGTSPGLSMIYVHLNRIITQHTAENILLLTGPGHGGPAIVANTWMEGTYSEVYPLISRDLQGMKRLFRQFSTPGGIPSHVGPPTPGSIHEGGELGYVLTHAFGAVMDNPDLLAVAVVGDGEAETGPLEGSWKGISYLNPVHDGAVLPILHLNGYKISGLTVLGRETHENIESLFRGHGYHVHWVEGDEPRAVHQRLSQVLDACIKEIKHIQQAARAKKEHTTTGITRPRWPLIVFRTPKGWTGPKEVDGKPVAGTWRAHQVPLSEVLENPSHLQQLEAWMRSYRPHELFDTQTGRLIPALEALAPKHSQRMSANPHSNAGHISVPLVLPELSAYALSFSAPAQLRHPSTTQLGQFMRDLYKMNPHNFRLFCPDETNSNKLGAVFEQQQRCFEGQLLDPSIDERVSSDGRVMEVLSEHNCEGWLEGYCLTGRHGLFASYEAFTLIVASMVSQHAKWLEVCSQLPWRAPLPSLNILLTSTCWRNDHNGFSHQGPGFMDTILSKRGLISRVYLPCDANTLLRTMEHCFTSMNYVNIIIIDKQPQLQYLSLDEARAHCKEGMGVWQWASNDGGQKPDIVFACCGDTPTQETLAAVSWLREKAPGLKIRVVNVVDALSLYLPSRHPHGVSTERFNELFTTDVEVVFAFHGYPGAVHQLIHGRPRTDRFHVRGYMENGTTTTPFDMVVLNQMSRYHLAAEGLKRLNFKDIDHSVESNLRLNTADLVDQCEQMLAKHEKYVHEHFDDLPEIKNWTWKTQK